MVFDRLSPRQKQVAEMVHAGKKGKEIEGALGISQSTVQAYLTQIYLKYGVDNRAGLAREMEREKAAAK